MTSAGLVVQQPFRDQPGSGFWSRLVCDVAYARDTLGFYRRLESTGRRPFSARMRMGDFWGSGDPEMIREIFTASGERFGDPVGPRVLAPLLGARSILLLGGEAHRRDRTLLMPPFHGERMRAYGEVIARATVRRAEAACGANRASVVELTQRVSLDVILDAVFGIAEEERTSWEHVILRTVHHFTVPLMFFPFLRVSFFGLSPWDRFEKARAALDQRLLPLIEARRESGERGEDILSLMLDARYEDGTPMPADQLRDELVTMLMAGHETSAIALSWTVDHVLRNPDIKARLLEELDSIDIADAEAVARLPYLGAVCAEGLRLHPVVPDISRVVVQPFRWGGQPVEAGDQVAVAICLLHENETLYPEPEKFRPERFLGRTFKPWEYCPFGGGNRRCIGAAFALYEMKIALAQLFSHFDMTLLEDTTPQPVRRNVTMGPNSTIPVRMERRGRRPFGADAGSPP